MKSKFLFGLIIILAFGMMVLSCDDPNEPWVDKPELTGSVYIPLFIQENVQTTALVGNLNAPLSSLSFQWQKQVVSTSTNEKGDEYTDYSWEDISGAKSISYTPPTSMVGTKIRIQVTANGYKKDDYHSNVSVSDEVIVFASTEPAPVVNSVAIVQLDSEGYYEPIDADLQLKKGGESFTFYVEVEGTDLYKSSSEEPYYYYDYKGVVWTLEGATHKDTMIESYSSYGKLTIALLEKATALTVRATSLADPTKTATQQVTVLKAAGHIITVSGVEFSKEVTWVPWGARIDIFISTDPIQEHVVACNRVETRFFLSSGNTISLVMYEGNQISSFSDDISREEFKKNHLTGWVPDPDTDYYMQLYIYDEVYYYTNGKALNVNGIDDIFALGSYIESTLPTIKFSGLQTNLSFSKFKHIEVGKGGYELTINDFGYGSDNMNFLIVEVGRKMEATWSIFEEQTVARGYGLINNGRAKVNLGQILPWKGWTEGGEYYIHIWQEPNSYTGSDLYYLYADTNSFEAANVSNVAKLNNAPKYTFSGKSSTVSINKFLKLNEIPDTPVSVKNKPEELKEIPLDNIFLEAYIFSGEPDNDWFIDDGYYALHETYLNDWYGDGALKGEFSGYGGSWGMYGLKAHLVITVSWHEYDDDNKYVGHQAYYVYTGNKTLDELGITTSTTVADRTNQYKKAPQYDFEAKGYELDWDDFVDITDLIQD